MFNLKRFSKALVLSLTLALTVPTVAPLTTTAVAEAASVKLNLTKKTLEVGKKVTLKVSGTKKAVKWSSSKTSVATVSSGGKVTAKKAGSATISAKVDGKTLKCKITVVKANKYVAKAPFDAKLATLSKYSFAIPEKWETSKTTVQNTNMLMLVPENADLAAGTANITVAITKNSAAQQKNFNNLKAAMELQVTKDYISNLLASQLGMTVDVKNFKMTTKKYNSGKALVTSYEVHVDGEEVMTQTIIDLFANGYTTEVTVTDNNSKLKPDIDDVAEYILDSLVY